MKGSGLGSLRLTFSLLVVLCVLIIFQYNVWSGHHELEELLRRKDEEVGSLRFRMSRLQEEVRGLQQRERYLEGRWGYCEYYVGRTRKRLGKCRLENEKYALKYMEVLQRHPNETNEMWYAETLAKTKTVLLEDAQKNIEQVKRIFAKRDPSRVSRTSMALKGDLKLKDRPKTYPNVRFQRLLPPIPPSEGEKKLVGLAGVRNVIKQIPFFLLSYSKHVDSIVLLDDHSTDGTGQLVADLAHLFNVEILVNKTKWIRDENLDHNLLLRAGRELASGTHFIMLDYDEAFTPTCLENNELRNRIFLLHPGNRLYLEWILLWNSTETYRPGFLDRKVITIQADDGKSLNQGHNGTSFQLHLPRLPETGRVVDMSSSDCKIVEFRFLNLDNVSLKEVWYYCIGRVRGNTGASHPGMSSWLAMNETIRVESVNDRWIDDDLRLFAQSMDWIEPWRAIEVLKWFKDYDPSFFSRVSDDHIWIYDWAAIEDELNRTGGLSYLPRATNATIRSEEEEEEEEGFGIDEDL